MKHYKDANNNIYAYESDGSQDKIIKKSYITITDDEVTALLLITNPPSESLPEVDPIDKLKNFLAANPDVALLLK